MTFISELQKIGLTDKESKVYLAMLELGDAPVQTIAKKAGVNRTTTYVILESLIQKGLCSTYLKAKKTYYMAESPETLGSLYAVQIKEIEEKQKNLENILPRLKAIYQKIEDKPVVRFFEGKEGLRAMSMELISSKEKMVRMMYSVDKLQRVFTEKEIQEARKIRVSKDIKTRVLYTFRDGTLASSPDGERIKISEKNFPVSADIALFDNKVRIASLGEKKLSGVIIQDQEIYRTLVSLFDLAWEAAKENLK